MKSVKADWKYVAMALERLLLWIFTLAVLVGTAGIILQAPTLHDHRTTIEKRFREFATGSVAVVKADWKYVAMALERLLLWIFTLSVLVGTAGIILQAPTLHDHRTIIEKRFREFATGSVAVVRSPSQPVLPILVIVCNRVSVRRCLDKLVKYRPNPDTFPIIISQDCNHNKTYQVIQSYATPGSGITVVQQPLQSDVPLPQKKAKFQGYYRIARHYKFALSHVLDTLHYESVVIVEDDLDIAKDFYEYFLGTYPLLKEDRSLWCISAWNDNGKEDLIDLSHPEHLHRTDFFPGLGWLLPARVWKQFKHKWPQVFWDDWLREPEQTRGRSCIRPEISRTSTFGKKGVSKGQYFDRHLRFIKLNDQFVPFTQFDLSPLLKHNYDRQLVEMVAAAQPLTAEQVVSGVGAGWPACITYTNQVQFKEYALLLGLMDDFRSGVPRTAYRGLVSCFYKNRRVYIVPAPPLTKYDRSWT